MTLPSSKQNSNDCLNDKAAKANVAKIGSLAKRSGILIDWILVFTVLISAGVDKLLAAFLAMLFSVLVELIDPWIRYLSRLLENELPRKTDRPRTCPNS